MTMILYDTIYIEKIQVYQGVGSVQGKDINIKTSILRFKGNRKYAGIKNYVG